MAGFLRAAAFRVAVLFAIAVTATTAIVFGVVRQRFYASNVGFARAVLADEMGKVIDEPADRLRRQLELRLTQDIRHLDYVALDAPDGQRILGNLPRGIAVPLDGHIHILPAPLPQEAWQSAQAVFVARSRPDGGVLVLGRSLAYVDRLEDAMGTSFAIALLPTVLVALLIGAVAGARAFRRLAEIQDAIARVMAGEIAVRLPARGTPDDVDKLVRAVNRMLDEIGRLVGQLRSVGDNIAHDLRAPLAVTRIRLERGLAGHSEAELRTACAEALDDIDRAMTTATALLRISELESGMRRSAFAPLDFAAVAADAFDLFEPLAEVKGITMTLSAPGPIMIAGDGDLLREAVANLLDNAVKYTPEGGRIGVECGSTEGPLLRIADTGPGVSDDERDNIFKRFYRSKHSQAAAGVGLGLSMAATIFDLHGYRLGVRNGSALGHGACFEIVQAAPHARA